jgi:hypothetical protein
MSTDHPYYPTASHSPDFAPAPPHNHPMHTHSRFDLWGWALWSASTVMAWLGDHGMTVLAVIGFALGAILQVRSYQLKKRETDSAIKANQAREARYNRRER